MSKSKKKKSIVPNRDSKSTSPSSKLVGTQVYQQHRGPLPSPEQLEKYEKFIPGSAERIIKMAEDGFNHRHRIEKETLKIVNEDRRRGQWMAFILGTLGILSAVFLGLKGYSFSSIGVGLLGTIVITAQVIMSRMKD